MKNRSAKHKSKAACTGKVALKRVEGKKKRLNSMTHLPISRFGRGLFDFDNFFGKSLDFFDPFDRWDMSLSPQYMRSLDWIREPPSLTDRPTNKFRLTLPATGYHKDDITTTIIDRTLKVHGKHVDKQVGEDYSAREFLRTFQLPRDIDESKLTSFITASGTLVIEIPFRSYDASISTQQISSSSSSQQQQQSERRIREKSPSDFYRCRFLPMVVDDRAGAKKVEMNVELPNYQPDEIQLTLKDRDLILKAESCQSTDKQYAKQYLYRQVTLPAGTNTDKLISTFENGTLHIEAPYSEKAVIQIQ